ncbi:hypothetical protein BV898_00943 [Hypsibius exemplaris]|uniref:BTB domain-containing protein n=1 Tax=Hypsibius exemplaris TaxID=2072580 RepID=A0A1W0XCQ3_HYPEX|nr:hypothetical protein BV898_00943 [Hypsibius exemplaris]
MLKVLKNAVAGAGDAIRRKPRKTTPDKEAAVKFRQENDKKMAQLLAEDRILADALIKSKRLLEKSPSQETLNIIFGHKPKRSITHCILDEDDGPTPPPLDALANDEDAPIKAHANVEPVDPLSLTPLDHVLAHKHYTREEVLILRGLLGHTQQELEDHGKSTWSFNGSLYVQRREECGCDTKLIIAGQRIIGHRVVFAAFSAVLAKLYGGSTLDQIEIITRDLQNMVAHPKALKRVLAWMYTGKMKPGKHLDEMRDVAEKLSMKTLLKSLEDYAAPAEEEDPVPLNEKPSSEFSFKDLEKTPEEMAVLVDQAAKKTSADALVSKIQNEVKEEAETIGQDGPQAVLVLPKIPFKYEPDDMYVAFRDAPTFVKMSAEKLFFLLSSDYIRVRSEFDVYEAAWKWFTHSLHQRKQYLDALMSCVRWAYLTVQDMVRVRSLDPQFFHHKVVSKNVSRAKWYQDLLARGVVWKDYKVPLNRLLGC